MLSHPPSGSRPPSTSSPHSGPVALPGDRSSTFLQSLVRAANGSVGHPSSTTSSLSSTPAPSPAMARKENQPLPPLPPPHPDSASTSSQEDSSRKSLQETSVPFVFSVSQQDKPLPLQPTQGHARSSSEHFVDGSVLTGQPPSTLLPSLSAHHNRTSSTSTISSASSASFLADQGPSGSRVSVDHPPPYSFRAGNRGSTLIASAPLTEEHLFQIQELTPTPHIPSHGPLLAQFPFVCASTMHDQQYLLVGSGNALHSIDLTLPSDRQSIKTHIQGVAFKEIHCLEDIGLVVVIAGRSSRVRCYDYDSIKRLVSYGHSAEGKGRVVEGGKLGPVKNKIQLRVETALAREENSFSDGPHSSPGGRGHSTAPAIPSTRHQHTSSIDKSLLSPPVRLDSPGLQGDSGSSDQDTKKKQRPLSFGGLASFAQEHVMRAKGHHPQQQQQQQQTSAPTGPSSTPTSPSSKTSTKNKRFSQMASYLSHAAANSNMASQIVSTQDAPSEEAMNWAWDFTPLKQTKDVIGLDFHYTTTTVFMTVLSKNGIDIYSRPRSTRGRKAKPLPHPGPGTTGTTPTNGNVTGDGEAVGRSSMHSIGGMVTSGPLSINLHHHRDSDPYEWRQYKQFYHPEAPSFMTVVKDTQEVTDIILGKGPRACVINVEDMSVNDLHRQETSSVIHGIGKKLGFRNSSLWHSFERIPFDVPPHILFPAAAEAVYGGRDRDRKAGLMGGHSKSSSVDSRSQDDIIQRSSDQQTFHQLQQREQEEVEARIQFMKAQQLQLQAGHGGASSSSTVSSSGSHVASGPTPATSGGASASGTTGTGTGKATAKTTKKTRMVTSDEVLNNAFSQRTQSQLFLATYGSQSRIVDIQGKAQSRVVLEWDSCPSQKVEFLRTAQDLYVIGFEKNSIVIFSLTRAKKIKEIFKKDLVPSGHSSSVEALTMSTIKFLGRDNVPDDSLGLFFSYCHPRNGISICKLGIVPAVQDELELVGYYP